MEESKDMQNRKYVEGLMTNDIMRNLIFFASKGKEKAPKKKDEEGAAGYHPPASSPLPRC